MVKPMASTSRRPGIIRGITPQAVGAAPAVPREATGNAPLQWPPPSMSAIRACPLTTTSPTTRQLKWLPVQNSHQRTMHSERTPGTLSLLPLVPRPREHATDKDAGMMENRGLQPLVDIFDDIAPFYPDTDEPGVAHGQVSEEDADGDEWSATTIPTTSNTGPCAPSGEPPTLTAQQRARLHQLLGQRDDRGRAL